MKKSKKNFKKDKKNNYKERHRDFKNKQDFFKKENKEKLEEDNLQLEGRNSVLEALNSGKLIDKIFIKKGEIEGTLKVIIAKAKEKGIIIKEIDKAKLEQMKKTNNPQGVIAICPAYEYCEVYDILNYAKEKNEPPFIIILDELTDPYNVGAIIRTAEATNVHGVIIPKRRSATLTSIVSKASAGAIEYVKIAKVNNISKEIEKLKKEGIWVVCADMKGTSYFEADLKGALAIVIGNEGSGVSRLVKERCDYSIKIPMHGKIQSLNASVAAGLIMYEVCRQKAN